ncbi:MAG: DUF503 domain-containing protein [Acidobacteria bacterium]|nr:MAG: DUF503 domain-containing protein [Acidobacteriota bacterium]
MEIHLPGVASLKEKRQVLRSLKDGLRGHYNVSVAEIDHQDLWQRATLGIVGIASARVPLEQTFSSIQDEVERKVPGEVLSSEVEFLT